MSFYNRERHLLYVNEYRGSFLKIDGEGKVTRLRNGNDDMLFADGEEAQCDPLHANLEAVNRKFATDSGKVTADAFEAIINSRGLYPGDDRPHVHRIGSGRREDSLITKHILDTIIYPEEGPKAGKNDETQRKLLRLFGSKSMMSWSELLKDAVCARLEIFSEEDRVRPFYRDISPVEHDKIKTILAKLMNFKIWKSPADSEVDRVLSDNKSAVKEWLKKQGLDIGYLLS
jgi:hypothetical protein